MKLIVGLGNWPKEYTDTRHNIGFMVIDEWLKKHNLELTENKFNGKFIKFKNEQGESFIVAKPYTYMNLSGQFVKDICQYYDIDPTDILIFLDDLDTPLGQWRIKTSGSSAGQKGMQNIIDSLYREDIKRVRIGIGRPTNQCSIIDWVIGKFTSFEKQKVEPLIKKSTDLIDEWIKGTDFQKIISKFN